MDNGKGGDQEGGDQECRNHCIDSLKGDGTCAICKKLC